MTKPKLTSFATTRPVAILMLFLATVVFGYFSFWRLPVTLMPELTYPTLTVRTEYPGAAPEEVENDISRPVEEALGVVGGLKKLSSVSRADVSDVVLEFAWDTEMSEAIQDVLERLDLVMLPDEAKRPLILHYDPSLDPILELSLSGGDEDYEGEGGLRRLRRLADLQIKRALEPIKGVAAVRVKGGLEEEIHVLVEEEQLRRTGISIGQVITRLGQENINVAGGTIKDGRTEYLVRTINEYEGVEQIADTVVASFDGRDVRIRDLGRVVASHKEREIITRTDGGASVRIEIYKEADTNSVALARRVKEALGESDLDLIIASAAAPVAVGDDDGSDDEGSGAAPGLATTLYREEGALLQIVADRSVFIQSSIREVGITALIGGGLAILVLFLFLKRFWTTVIIGVSIPISLLMVFAPLNLLGITLNIMSLGGLALGIGMLVDSSIVVLESIHRCREEGDDVSSAAVRGTGEVRGAVLASTLTSIAVFFPMVFVEGVAGQAFGDLGLAVVVSLLAAAGVALFFIPMLASRGGGARRESAAMPGPRAMLRFAAWEVYRPSLRRPLGWFRAAARPAPSDAESWRRRLRNLLKPFRFGVVALGAGFSWLYFTIRFVLGTVFEWVIGKPLMLVFSGLVWVIAKVLWPALGLILRPVFWLPVKLTDWAMKGLSGVYPAVLRRSLANPLVIVLVVGACFWGTWKVVTALDSELLPEVHQGEFTVEVELPVGTPLEETDLVLSPIEDAILAERDHIRALIVTLGYDSANSQRSDEGEHTARFKVMLEETRDPAGLEQQVVSRLRERFEGVPDLQARIVRPVLFSSRTPIEVEIHGDELHRLKLYADRASEVMTSLTGLTDVQATLQSGAPEVQIVYDRDRLARYGMNVGEVARLVRDKVQGFEATRLNLKDRRIPIMVRLAADDRETVADVEGVIVNPGQTPPLPLASVAEVTLGEGPSEVRRVDGRRVALIRANIGEGSLGSATASIENALRSRIDWPSDMTFLITGQQEEWEHSQGSLWFALGLSIFLVYVIMAAQFESLIHPLVIMVSIPLAFIGTVVALLLLGISLSVVVFLGMIMLAGIVVNNAIVLVDYINRLRRRGMPRDEAIVTAGSVRLRPILMTTATTVLGLLPMALGLGDGAELRTPMAIAVISGLISSTVLTLIVIPSLYAIADTMVAKLMGKREQDTRETEATPSLETLHGAGRGAVTP